MLLERARTLSTKIGQYQQLQASADEAQQIATRASQIARAAERIRTVRQQIEAYAAAGVPVDFVPADAATYGSRAQALKLAVAENPVILKSPPFDLKYDFLDRLEGIAKAAERALDHGWKNYISKRGSFGSNDVLEAFSAVPQFRANVSRIRDRRGEIARLAQTVPTDPKAAVAKLEDLLREHDAAWADLGAADIPQGVIRFIRAAATDGAPLDNFSDEVKAWLEGRSLLGVFRIRTR